MIVTIEELHLLAPNANPLYVAAFAPALAEPVFEKYGVTTPLRMAHFMAQVLHETGDLFVTVESLDYTHAERIRSVWPSRFPTVASAAMYVRNPQLLAEKVYGGRADLGNTQPGDGWKFVGRGASQITGRANYTRVGHALSIDLVGNPGLVFIPANVLAVALEDWGARGGWIRFADADDIRSETHVINGGYVGLQERIAKLAKVKAVLMLGA